MTNLIPTEASDASPDIWWGDKPLDSEGRARFQIGSLSLWIHKYPREWWLARELLPLGLEDAESVAEESAVLPEKPPDTAQIERVAVESNGNAVRLSPRLADRSVVSRPETPLTLPPLATVDLFVSAPVWVLIEALEPLTQLVDIPTRLLSQTWFGPSAMEGELCYAARTRARVELDERQVSPYRALSKITVRNGAETSLLIERINLPTRALALFADRRGNLWTPSLSVVRKRDGRLSEIRLQDEPPVEAEAAKELSPARELESQNYLARALHALIR